MVSAAHTPGPWEYEAGDPLSCVSTSVDGRYTDIAYLSLPNHAANARLIAAAPDLLRLCELVNDSFGGGCTITFTDSDIEDFAAVIAKAKGGAA